MTIEEIRTGLSDMLLGLGSAQEIFKRETYPTEFEDRYQEHLTFMEKLHGEFQKSGDMRQFTAQIADAPAMAAQEVISEFKSRNKRETRLMDFNLNMVAFVNPVLLMFPSEYFDYLVDSIIEEWGKAFPKFKIKKADYAIISTGFKRKYCYITTAVCTSMGLGDDCYELNLLRDYRDDFLAADAYGRELIREYYDIAPTIVSRINTSEDPESIYSGLYDSYISKCIAMIEKNELSGCRDTYVTMVEELKEKYLYQ